MVDFTDEIKEHEKELTKLKRKYSNLLEEIKDFTNQASETIYFFDMDDYSDTSDLIRLKSYDLKMISNEIYLKNRMIKQLQWAMEASNNDR